MSELLPKVDVSHLGEPSEERKALDWLGGFDYRRVVATWNDKKVKKFRVHYVGKDKWLWIDYEESKGSTKAVKIYRMNDPYNAHADKNAFTVQN
ncbi:hypothetical protein bas27_0055 [Escherichia phage TrudiGerster]|uniref:Uncharacterized protein n=1 Tax=Escherichia phage TrudiGerster TaxID=2851991 RepID=A0AAE8B8D7_9CAUD|nr:hypothetical protein bas27_0055 [Escherichia phage TrudiGerster]